MTATLQSLGIDKLSLEEQLNLVQAIWDHIATTEKSPGLSAAQRDELRRRVADDDASPNNVVPWERVKAAGRFVS